jgi:hypothetical protein
VGDKRFSEVARETEVKFGFSPTIGKFSTIDQTAGPSSMMRDSQKSEWRKTGQE